MTDVLIVSAGMESPKKRDSILARRQQYLNYGALTLATILHHKGYRVKLLHGSHESPLEFAHKLFAQKRLPNGTPLLLSITSFYALSWTQQFTSCIKKLCPGITIVVGGRWVIGSDVAWIRSKLPFVDCIVPGLADDFIEQVVVENGNAIPFVVNGAKASSFNLDHRLVDDFLRYQPSVEASRGCGMGCAFCEERDIPLTPLKDPEVLVSHMLEVAEHYQDDLIRPYLQSSFFAPNRRWAEKMALVVEQRQMKIEWRCETRVDVMKSETVALLSKAGLRVIDLGMESASETQLLRMRKSESPDVYLRKASDLIKACRDNGVWVKLNVLLYAGETIKTHMETLDWLDEHASAIKGVSVGPVVIFGSPTTAAPFIDDAIASGAYLVDPKSAGETGISHIHPSKEISSVDAERLSIEASRRYMTEFDYFDLKSFSYYSREYTWADFKSDVGSSDSKVIPFKRR